MKFLSRLLGLKAEANASSEPRLFCVDRVTLAAANRITRRAHCICLSIRTKSGNPAVPTLHTDDQDVTQPGWNKIADYLASCRSGRSSVFEPSTLIPAGEMISVITLPQELGELKNVETIRLYGSHLRRLPPEIGRLSNLKELDIYTSYSLHWLPYEILRCRKLSNSRMSTRALYGNRNTRLPFPRLRGPVPCLTPQTCSICDEPFDGRTPQLFWATQAVGTDYVPLLAHSCSNDCTASIPDAPPGFHARPHKGGGGVGMPSEKP